MMATMLTRWPHQVDALASVQKAFAVHDRVLLCSPTGGGKSLICADVIDWAVSQGWRVCVYVNRRLLVDNLITKFHEAGIRFGVAAADYEAYTDLDAPVQLRSIQTAQARVINQRKRALTSVDAALHTLGDFELVIRDEAHIQDYTHILSEHVARGAKLLGMTATPLGLANLYDHLLVAGQKSQLFRYDPPALMPAHCAAIEEWQLKDVKRNSDGEFIINGKLRKVFTQHIVGSVIHEWEERAYGRPTLLMASGVPESVYFAKQFEQRGHPWAHLDATRLYVDGKVYAGRDSCAVQDVIERTKPGGDLRGISARFRLREGVDLPWLSCLILATPIGSMLSYFQVVGRILRYHESCDEKRILDHGGNWWRFPSPNRDIDWHDLWDLPVRAASEAHHRSVVEGNTKPGYPCPHCGEVMKTYRTHCRICGKEIERKAPIRRVVMEDGRLKDVSGFVVPRRTKLCDGTERLWQRVYWGARKHRPTRTFGQCWAWFCKQHYEQFRCHPPRDLPLMPRSETDWYRPVGRVPMGRLRPRPPQGPTHGNGMDWTG